MINDQDLFINVVLSRLYDQDLRLSFIKARSTSEFVTYFNIVAHFKPGVLTQYLLNLNLNLVFSL